MSTAASSALARMAFEAGHQVHAARVRRGWTLRDLADRAGVSPAVVHGLETGDTVSQETIARVATALGMRPSLVLADSRDRTSSARAPRLDGEDFVHAAMGEVEAQALARPQRTIAIDEPYQHYQFAGRADVLVRDHENLLHIENRTRFPNIQEAAGAWNAKRQYLARSIADRAGVGPRRWRSVTHVMAGLWSSEVLHAIRLRRASFTALCPDPPDAFQTWLYGEEPAPGTTSTLVVLDPAVPFGSRRRTVARTTEPPILNPRYRGYADAAAALRRAKVPG
jgi:transcriptional regulator with XRE-family HTH domain